MHLLVDTFEEDRHRDEERRHAHRRALLEARGGHASPQEWLAAAFLTIVRRDDHSLTNYPCRLPNGSIGRIAVAKSGREWTLVCRVA